MSSTTRPPVLLAGSSEGGRIVLKKRSVCLYLRILTIKGGIQLKNPGITAIGRIICTRSGLINPNTFIHTKKTPENRVPDLVPAHSLRG